MNFFNRISRRGLAAGSLAAAAVVAALVPLNMGGCSGGNVGAITGAVTSAVTGQPSNLGGGGGGSSGAGGYVASGVSLVKAATIDASEPALGEAVALRITSQYGVTADEKLNEYVIMVGRTVADQTDRTDWLFGVVDTDEVNAYSGPGGYVFVTKGALKRMRDESELAGLLAHEIGHVAKKHGIEIVRRSNLLQGGLQAGNAAAGGRSDFAALFPAFDALGDAVLIKGWGQTEESDADAEAVRLASAAGYDPNGLVRFLQRVEGETDRGGPAMSTHPGTGDRIRNLTSQIQREGLRGARTNEARFRSVVTIAK